MYDAVEGIEESDLWKNEAAEKFSSCQSRVGMWTCKSAVCFLTKFWKSWNFAQSKEICKNSVIKEDYIAENSWTENSDCLILATVYNWNLLKHF